MLKALLNKKITRWKGNNYIIDEKVPSSYLFFLSVDRGLMLLRGKLSGISNKGKLFLSSHASIKWRRNLRLGNAVTISRGCFIDALSDKGIELGDNVSLGMNTRIEGTGNLRCLGKGMKVGNNVGLGSDSFYGCAGGIEIGDDTIIGNFVSFHSENHVFDDIETPIRLQGVRHAGIWVGRNCWIGAKATILDGANIGDGCIIAAGALVTAGKYSSNCIYGGVPARLIKKRNDRNETQVKNIC